MTVNEEKVAEEALQLSKGARADLAARLLESLEGDSDESDEVGAEEIERRARLALSGQTQGTDAEVVESRVEAHLRRR